MIHIWTKQVWDSTTRKCKGCQWPPEPSALTGFKDIMWKPSWATLQCPPDTSPVWFQRMTEGDCKLLHTFSRHLPKRSLSCRRPSRTFASWSPTLREKRKETSPVFLPGPRGSKANNQNVSPCFLHFRASHVSCSTPATTCHNLPQPATTCHNLLLSTQLRAFLYILRSFGILVPTGCKHATKAKSILHQDLKSCWKLIHSFALLWCLCARSVFKARLLPGRAVKR